MIILGVPCVLCLFMYLIAKSYFARFWSLELIQLIFLEKIPFIQITLFSDIPK